MPPQATTRQTIALIGLSGTGKSTLAHLLAERLNWKHVDTDEMIVRFSGKPVAEYFASSGESAFRTLENEILGAMLMAATFRPSVMATGGGIVLRPDNRDLLRQFAWNVWLDAPTPILLARLQQQHDEPRPLLAGDDSASRLAAMRATREPLYRELAHLMIDTSTMPTAAIVELIVTRFGRQMRR